LSYSQHGAQVRNNRSAVKGDFKVFVFLEMLFLTKLPEKCKSFILDGPVKSLPLLPVKSLGGITDRWSLPLASGAASPDDGIFPGRMV